MTISFVGNNFETRIFHDPMPGRDPSVEKRWFKQWSPILGIGKWQMENKFIHKTSNLCLQQIF